MNEAQLIASIGTWTAAHRADQESIRFYTAMLDRVQGHLDAAKQRCENSAAIVAERERWLAGLRMKQALQGEK